jgi:hypothetical protein
MDEFSIGHLLRLFFVIAVIVGIGGGHLLLVGSSYPQDVKQHLG